MNKMEQWQVARTECLCAGSGEKLTPGTIYYASLVDAGETFERKDFSEPYWDNESPEVFSYWKTVIQNPNEKKKLLVDDNVLVNLFERLETVEEAAKLNFRFVLNLILMRKRRVKYEGSYNKNDQEFWKMRLVREKKYSDVLNPNLTESEIEAVSQELSSILNSELE